MVRSLHLLWDSLVKGTALSFLREVHNHAQRLEIWLILQLQPVAPSIVMSLLLAMFSTYYYVNYHLFSLLQGYVPILSQYMKGNKCN